jgi:OPA family glycerol-3-phosphate transporter-like MFS transporter/OPA family sugar phosphate sensor protein UhpC-like MFS transporter
MTAVASDPPSQGAPVDSSSAEFRYWQKRILVSTIIGYALYYFVRKNLSYAMPLMEADLGIGKTQLGGYLTAHGLIYGAARFINGVWADRANARWVMASGLAVCAGLNLMFGLSTSVVAFGIIWALNGWFQGFGFPPVTRLMTHWFPPQRLATVMSVWNSGHSIGGAGVAILCQYLVVYNWQLCFFVPAAIAFVGAIALAIALRDTPESMGMPPVKGTEHIPQDDGEPLFQTLRRLVFANPYIWLLGLANFFVYIVRYGIIDWGPTFLKEARGVDLKHSGWVVAAFEVAGILGMLSSGWITDRLFGGRGPRACVFYMLGSGAAIWFFRTYPSSSVIVNASILAVAGFFIYGPQCLIGISAANLATKRAAAASAGLTGLFGYLSTSVSGIGVGWLVSEYKSWDSAFLLFGLSTLAGTLLFILCWPAKAHGYHD